MENQMDEHGWNGEGWYRIAFSDGQQDWTNDGAIWLETRAQYEDEMEAARATETETHLAYSNYIGRLEDSREGE